MSRQAKAPWNWDGIRARRFTLIDVMTVVAMLALIFTAMAGAREGDIDADRKASAFVLAAACPALAGLLWFLSGIDMGRARWLNAFLTLAIILLTVVVALLVLTLGYIHPTTAALTCLTMPALIVYLATWAR